MFDRGELEAIEAAVRDCVSSFDAISCAEAARVVNTATAIENMAAAIKALAAARAAQNREWKRGGHRSPAERLARDTGTSVADAHNTLKRGEQLDARPDVAQAALDGKLSPAQASAIAGAAIVNPAAAPKLLNAAAAGGSLADLKRQCGEAKAAVVDREARRRWIFRRRRLRTWTDDDGEAHIAANGNPEDIAQFSAFLQPLADVEFDKARRDGRREHPDAYRFDALINFSAAANAGTPTRAPDSPRGAVAGPLAEHGGAQTRPDERPPEAGTPAAGAGGGHPDLAANDRRLPNPGDAPAGEPAVGDAASFTGLDDGTAAAPDLDLDLDLDLDQGRNCRPDPAIGPAPRPNSPPTRRGGRRKAKRAPAPPRPRTGAPAKLIIRIDLDAFLRGYTIGDEICDLPGHGPIAVSALRDLLKSADPFVAVVFTKAQQIAGVAHLGRRPTSHQQTVLEWLYPTCAAEGCPATARLERDHRQDWANTHVTLVDWLDLLCEHYHDLKTRFGWALVQGVGKRPFVPPTTRDTPATTKPPLQHRLSNRPALAPRAPVAVARRRTESSGLGPRTPRRAHIAEPVASRLRPAPPNAARGCPWLRIRLHWPGTSLPAPSAAAGLPRGGRRSLP
ncbi:MAG: hypothetical protein ACRDZ8_04385 [Acidimicrobiales bacterium]